MTEDDDVTALLSGGEEVVGRKAPLPALPVALAVVYSVVMPVVFRAWLATALAAPDPAAAETIARWVYFPVGDIVLVLSGVMQAFSGYFVSDDAAVLVGSVPLVSSAVWPAIVHALIGIAIWWVIDRLVRTRRDR